MSSAHSVDPSSYAPSDLEPSMETPRSPPQIKVYPTKSEDMRSSIVEGPGELSDSSNSPIESLGAPYWKDFDRIQERSFRERAEQLHEVSQSPIQEAALARVEETHGANTNEDANMTVNGNINTDGGINVDAEMDSSSETHGWLSGIRNSLMKRRLSLPVGYGLRKP